MPEAASRLRALRSRLQTSSKYGRRNLNNIEKSTTITPTQSLRKCLAWLVIDSGCTFHLHNRKGDLINLRPCHDVIEGLGKSLVTCKYIGDLPLIARDTNGVDHKILIENVRCAPNSDSLLSVHQLWEEHQINAAFADKKCLSVIRGDGQDLELPIKWTEGLYQWHVLVAQRFPSATDSKPMGFAKALKASIHRAGSVSHIEKMSADDVAQFIHRRLHIGPRRLRSLPKLTADAPNNLSSVSEISCPACIEANATHLSHSGRRYQPSEPGRLIHGDIAGPFTRSVKGNRWALILVDDHSRFKFVYFLKEKSDAPARIRRFIADFNAKLSSDPSDGSIRRIRGFHSDNAGEFVSREFKELLDSSLVRQTTSPPHVHDLNGVAERAIRSVMSGARSDLAASNAPLGFWDAAVRHNVDILNRTTCPPDSERSCYESLTGDKPKIMHLMPFGCAAWAVKPDSMISKTRIESHAWSGIHVGTSSISPGSYDIWVPSINRTVNTSDAYFSECLFPWRPPGSRLVGEIPASPPSAPPPQTQPPGVPTAGAAQVTEATLDPPPADASLREAFAAAANSSQAASAAQSRHVLLLFSGPYGRQDGLAAYLRECGFHVTVIDNDAANGGNHKHDVLDNAFFDKLLRRVRGGHFFAIFAAPPCSTFSVSRFFETWSSRKGRGPPPVRDRQNPNGLDAVPKAHSRELRLANRLVDRTGALLAAAAEAGTEFILEHPADRGNPKDHALFLHHRHAPLWLHSTMKSLAIRTSARFCTFAQCMFGAEYQKYTTLMYSPGLAASLDSLDRHRCTHESHPKMAGGFTDGDGQWDSRRAAAYPPAFCSLIARRLRNLRFGEAAASDSGSAPNETSHVVGRIENGNAVAETRAPPTAPMLPPPSAAAPDAEGEVVSAPPPPPTPTPRVTEAFPTASSPTLEDITSAVDEPVAGAPAALRKLPKTDSGDSADNTSRAFAHGPSSRTRQRRGTASALLCSKWSPWISAAAAGCADGRAALARARKAKASSTDPKNHREAMTLDQVGWTKAEETEIANHISNGSWTEIDQSEMPRGRRLVRMTWAYKTKRDGRQKARLCVQGCSQVPGVDYDQTFCATMRSGTLRLLCAAAAHWDLRMRRFDFVAAYLQGELEEGETVYCSLPPGYETVVDKKGVRRPNVGADGKPRIYRIEKPVYGMAQAGRRWQRTLFPWMLDPANGFKQSTSDECVFTIMRSVDTPQGPRDEKLLVGCYVDDLFIVYSHDDEHSLYTSFVNALNDRWEVEDEGEVRDLLNVEIERDGNCVNLTQTGYIDKMMREYAPNGVPEGFQSTKTPCDKSLESQVLDALSCSEEIDPVLLRNYQSLVGALLYASINTRPDIAYATSYLCRAMSRPSPDLYDAALRVLFYLHRHREVGLCYVADGKPLRGMTDADWAVKHSTSGWVFQFCRAAITWGSKKQKSVALSSCESEIMAASEAAKEAVALGRFLTELGLKGTDDPVELGCDNKAAINLSYNPEHHERVKHVERRHFFIRECVENGQLTVPYVNTIDNLADFFTKPLQGDHFFTMRDAIMNCDSKRARSLRSS